MNYPDLWEFYTHAATPRAWFRELADHADDIGLALFASAFSVDGVKFLVDLGMPAIKIASHEIRDLNLIDRAVDTGLPVIVSTGLAIEDDIRNYADMGIVFLHCISQYPSTIEQANLLAIRTLRRYGQAGLSDHTPGFETAIAATVLGAVMIEKHLKLDDDCVDAAYSLDPQQFAEMCNAVRAVWRGLGDGIIRPTGQPRRR
jgi:sialic acid synthase SpsE